MAREPFNEEWASNPAPDQFEKPPIGTFSSGWVGGAQGQLPEAKWENWWHNRVDSALQQIERYGVMDWHPGAIYGIGGRARGSDGRFYMSVATPNAGNDPVTDDGSSWVEDLGAGQNIQVFNTAGLIEWPVPKILKLGYRKPYVIVIGAGASGGGDGGGGGGGGVAEKLVDLTGVETVTITIGAGGKGEIERDGENGESSSFGNYCSATGGEGYASAGGKSGVGQGGDINYGLGPGGATPSGLTSWAGHGGGPGGSAVTSPIVNADRNAVSPGGGGAGGGTGGQGSNLPGNGADGEVIIRW